MRSERVQPWQLSHHRPEISVVMDVFRATSTATVLIGRGVEAVRVVAVPADLEHLPPNPAGYIVISELPETARFGERIDNSPVLASSIALVGRVPVLVTTNGTRVLSLAEACSK